MFLIKSTKKISFEPKTKKIKRLNWFVKVTFSIFGKNEHMNVSYTIYYEIKDITRVRKNNEIYEKDKFFSKKSKSYYLHIV